MRFLKLTLAYDGTAYAGWQVQSRDRTIQETFEKAVEAVTGESLRVVASGRTDAGVHALGQVVSFATGSKLEPDVLRRALNANLPNDIKVLDVTEAPDDFHAIRDAVRKRYRYVIQDGPVPNVFLRHFSWYVPQTLDDAAMHRAAQCFLGEHDFTSFETTGSERATSVRVVSDVFVAREQREGRAVIVLEIEANGFLYNMVRAIVGTLVDVGRGSQPESWPAEVLAANNRKAAGMTAPPQGLFLVQVEYE